MATVFLRLHVMHHQVLYFGNALLAQNEVFVAEATPQGLKMWEDMLNLPIAELKNPSYRRSRILSKLRGAGTTTVELIENVASSFSNGEVDVIEHNDEYYFDVKFVGTKGIPPNLDDLKTAIEEIKPAHLGVNYIILYATHQDLQQYTHQQLHAYQYDQLKNV